MFHIITSQKINSSSNKMQKYGQLQHILSPWALISGRVVDICILLKAQKMHFKWEDFLMQCIFPVEIITKDIHTLTSSKQYYLFVMYLWTICATICRRAPMIQCTRFALCGICFHKSENNTLDRILLTFKPFQYKWQHLSCSSTAPCIVCAGFCPGD